MELIDHRTAVSLLEYGESILHAVVTGHPLPEAPDLPVLHDEYGLFSTLKKAGELRGCIGNFAGIAPLGEIMPRVIRESAFDDPRFPPVRPEEYPELDLSLSVLFPSQPVPSVDKIELGRDGTILSFGHRRAVFLPEVAVEQGWDRETMMEMLCRKARLPSGAWQRPGAEIETFRTLHISRDAVDSRLIHVKGE